MEAVYDYETMVQGPGAKRGKKGDPGFVFPFDAAFEYKRD
jgi:hypothetical protein